MDKSMTNQNQRRCCMEKKYLKKMLSGLSIASLVAGMAASAMAAGG